MAGKLSAFFGAQDMTVGNPATNLIRFSTPLLIGNLAQQLYSTVDSIVVGNYVGDSALAAIGASGPIINLLLVLFMGVSVGASIMASQCFGAKDKKRLSHSAGTAITATLRFPSSSWSWARSLHTRSCLHYKHRKIFTPCRVIISSSISSVFSAAHITTLFPAFCAASAIPSCRSFSCSWHAA